MITRFMGIFLLALCLAGSFSAQSYGAVVTVEMKNLAFVPQQVNINLGDTVRWTNMDSVPHSTTSGVAGAQDWMWDSEHQMLGEIFEFTFNTVGTFIYFCEHHPTTMTGTVVVTDPSTGSSTPNLSGAITTDKDIYAKGENLTLSGQVSATAMTAYDVYIIAETPTEEFYCLDGNMQFGGKNQFFPFLRDWNSMSIPPTAIFTTNVGNIPSGKYVFHIIFVNKGASLADTTRWQATAVVAFTVQ